MSRVSNFFLSNFFHFFSVWFLATAFGLMVLATVSPPTLALFEEEKTGTENPQPYFSQPLALQTQSRFERKLLTFEEEIPFSLKIEKDPTLPFGQENILQEGKKGRRTKIFEILYFEGSEYNRQQIEEKVQEPQEKIVAVGTKKIFQTENTSDGQITYFAKFRVWATSYDQNCRGCDGTTATGMKTGYGVIAVDPNLIPLGTRAYVPNYGFAIAGDTGGAIKGYKVDLGFDDVSHGWWSSRYTDIYLLE